MKMDDTPGSPRETSPLSHRLTLADTEPQTLTLSTLADEAREHVRNSKSDNTRRAYLSDWSDFSGWCDHHKRAALPALPETLALYLTDCAKGLKPSTLQRRLATISQAHRAAGYETPTTHSTVRAVWQGIRRSKGVATQGKEPAVTPLIRAMVDHLPQGKLISVRDRALLLVGFAGAMRRSEIVALDVADVSESNEGLIVTIRRSKIDQEGQGRKVGLPYGSNMETCPVRSVKA